MAQCSSSSSSSSSSSGGSSSTPGAVAPRAPQGAGPAAVPLWGATGPSSAAAPVPQGGADVEAATPASGILVDTLEWPLVTAAARGRLTSSAHQLQGRSLVDEVLEEHAAQGGVKGVLTLDLLTLRDAEVGLLWDVARHAAAQQTALRAALAGIVIVTPSGILRELVRGALALIPNIKTPIVWCDSAPVAAAQASRLAGMGVAGSATAAPTGAPVPAAFAGGAGCGTAHEHAAVAASLSPA